MPHFTWWVGQGFRELLRDGGIVELYSAAPVKKSRLQVGDPRAGAQDLCVQMFCRMEN